MPTCMPMRMSIHEANYAASGCSKWADLMAIKEFKVECVSACKAGTCHSPLRSDTRVDMRTDMQSRQQFVRVWHDSDAEAGRQRLWRRQRENHLLQVLPQKGPHRPIPPMLFITHRWSLQARPPPPMTYRWYLYVIDGIYRCIELPRLFI